MVAVEDIAAKSDNALATGPFGSSIGSDTFRSAGVPVIRGSNLSADVACRLDDSNLVFIDQELVVKFRRSEVVPGDLVFTCWGTVNQIGLIDGRSHYSRYVVSNKQMKLTLDPLKADPLFMYYWFSGPRAQQQILSAAIGSSVPGFNLGQLRRMLVPLPILPEQRLIAHILGTLDDKIELNRQTSRTLEARARAIFKAWFIDFDPVKAKAAGATNFRAMPNEIFDKLPDQFSETELGLIPKGWNLSTVGDLCVFNYGRALKADLRREGTIPVYGSNGLVGWHDESLVGGPGIVVGRKGNPGTVNWVATDFYPIDTTFYVSPSNKGQLPYLRYALEFLRLDSLAADSAVPGLGRNMAYGLPIVVPDQESMMAFGDMFVLHQEGIESNANQSQTLAAVRDELLTKLISGAVRVSGV